MNRTKRACALLLAIVLVLGIVIGPGIGGVFAEEITEPIEENAEPVEEITEPVEEITEPVEEVTEPMPEPAPEPDVTEEPTEGLLPEPTAEPEPEETEEPTTGLMPEPIPEPTEEPDEPTAPSFFEQLMACGSLAEFDAVLRAEENAAAPESLTQEELKQLQVRVEELCAAIGTPTEADSLLKEELLKTLNEYILVICPECGEANGHKEGCSQAKAEDEEYVWAALTDAELADWLMDEENAETVKAILQSEGEEHDALMERIDAILSGGDEELAMRLQAYLSELTGMDEAALLVADGTICFDLALGDINIGPSGYSGKINVNGVTVTVSGTHENGNSYYIYQSTEANRADTGYSLQEDCDAKQNCRVPVYERVRGGAWGDFVTNNTDVKGVSQEWETAAAAVDRAGTPYTITFKSGATYNVTLDNIWSTYHQQSASRVTGGITADLGSGKGTTINLELKGDNRFGNVHYFSKKGTGNTIVFSDGEDGANPGSITVADFPKNLGANYWCSAIGGNDSGHDPSDGIIIRSGVIYAGTTSKDDCTAIGGGGNEYGRVVIEDGRVTAVSASTGTAIGGGIGWGSQGGDADVTISGGEVYAYNFGIGPDSGNYTSFVPAVAIGGGSANTNNGNNSTTVTIEGGTVYAESVGGAAIGGGGSGTKAGGKATVNITGGTVIAKSVGKTVNYNKDGSTNHTEAVPAGVSIGGGTGSTGGGSVTLNISGDPIVRTGSIGGGKCTGSGPIGSATVEISGGDITGQVIMAGGSSGNCKFTMTGGRLHGSNVVDGNTITDITDPRRDVPISYLEKNGGAVWMADPIGVANVSGGTIEGCTAYRGGAIYMEGGTFNLSGGTICDNQAIVESATDAGTTGRGGGVYVTGGTANIQSGTLSQNSAQVRGGGLYVTSDKEKTGTVKVTGGLIQKNIAGFETATVPLPDNVGRGGGVYLEGGQFTMEGGTISDNEANYRGGGIFLTQRPTLTGGTICDNTANNSGGGLCINGDKLELKSQEMKIFGNSAGENGGGIAVLNGEFILDGGAVGVENGSPNTAKKGGGVFVRAESTSAAAGAAANATVLSGNIWYNKADQGGGIYLAEGEGNFTLEGKDAVISNNTATLGGGVYLYKDPLLNQGTITQNTASENGGGLYISDCLVTLNPTKDVTITQNTAKNGGGIYISGSSAGGSGGTETVDATSSATPGHKVGLLVDNKFTGTVSFTNNEADESGGAVCVNAGRFQLESDKITVTGNSAKNGGGVAVLQGNFTMTAGAIGESGGANTATNGGGVYVSGGQVWLKGGSVQYNEAENGGGAFVTSEGTAAISDDAGSTGSSSAAKDQFIMIGGALNNNSATQSGGGGYVAGNFHMLGGTVGGTGGGNSAQNGGGVYVNDGDVTIVYGDISCNSATKDGGGVFISATNKDVGVVMLSGSLSNNQAAGNGGGMAVESSNAQKISVEIGCLLNHDLAGGGGKPKYSIAYLNTDGYNSYAEFDGINYAHDSCPIVEHNQAGEIGGGFYMNSNSSVLSFYCVEETNNTAKGSDTAGMDVVGGKVIVGDEYYHNYKRDDKYNPEDQHVVPWGYIAMDDATLVNGGQVDIYGDMTNPVFKNEVTVDIEDTSDHFKDHRRSENETSYKVHYFENFQGGGLYQAIQYNQGETTIDVQGALYSHPGYRILGWCTKPVHNTADPDCYYYQVGTTIDLTDHEHTHGLGESDAECEFCGDDKDANLLVLYAIWEVNGYTVKFDPNVPDGETYSGKMDDQVFDYGQETPLRENAYRYPGHIFTGWNTEADGSGTAIEDQADGSKLTEENGVTLVLYAQWEKCDHTDKDRWSYKVIDEGKTLQRDCSCGGQTLTATLYAEDAVYDGHNHVATLTLDTTAEWGEDAPEIKYEAAWLKNDVLQHAPGTAPEFSKDGKPFHAGEYRASITKKNTVNGAEVEVVAFVDYTIEKAEQPAPEKPKYDVDKDNNQAIIKKLADDPTTITDDAGNKYQAKAEYCLTFVNETTVNWQNMPVGQTTLAITPTQALTNYYVQARYEELDDYKASEIKKADATYFFAGNVTVTIVCEEGINCKDVVATEQNNTTDGVTLTLETDSRYYLVGGKYKVTTDLKMKDPSASLPATPPSATETAADIYSVTNIPPESNLTITIGTAKKRPQPTAQVMPRQKFASFTGADETGISRDSAFTAAFQIDNFDPYYVDEATSEKHGVYDGLSLRFDSEVPADMSIIMLDRADGSYWYYCAGAGVDEVALTAFTKMGGTDGYVIPRPAEGSDYVDLSYQFIVDFSQSDGYPESSLKMTLEATVKDNDPNVPTVDPAVTVNMGTPVFTLEKTEGTEGLTRSVTCSFHADEAASRWENRASALVLTPDGSDLPPDARIKAETGSATTYLYKTGNSFLIPLSLLQNETKTVNLSLQSALFPATETTYTFTAEWLISASKAGKAPLNGDGMDKLTDVVFTFTPEEAPSLKITGEDRVLTDQDTLEVDIETLAMDGYTISAALLRKADDGSAYVETGWNQPDVTGKSVSVPLGGQFPGSFCLVLTVKPTGSITIVMEVPYYFVIKPTE